MEHVLLEMRSHWHLKAHELWLRLKTPLKTNVLLFDVLLFHVILFHVLWFHVLRNKSPFIFLYLIKFNWSYIRFKYWIKISIIKTDSRWQIQIKLVQNISHKTLAFEVQWHLHAYKCHRTISMNNWISFPWINEYSFHE